MGWEECLSIGSFAVTLGGFIATIWPPTPTLRRTMILLVCFLVFLTSTVVLIWRQLDEVKKEQVVTERVVAILSTEKTSKTVEQLQEDIPPEEQPFFKGALSKLVADGRVGHRRVPVKDGAGLSYLTTLYYFAN